MVKNKGGGKKRTLSLFWSFQTSPESLLPQQAGAGRLVICCQACNEQCLQVIPFAATYQSVKCQSEKRRCRGFLAVNKRKERCKTAFSFSPIMDNMSRGKCGSTSSLWACPFTIHVCERAWKKRIPFGSFIMTAVKQKERLSRGAERDRLRIRDRQAKRHLLFHHLR